VTAPILAAALLTAAVGLGLYLGLLHLRRVRKPVVIGAHLLLGVAGLETTVVMLRGAPDGITFAGSFGVVAAALLALALVFGFSTPLLGKRSRRTANILLATHAGIGVTAFVMFLAWLASL
jgi:hypothetical protein